MGYRFTRGGIEYFGDSPEMYAGVVRATFSLSDQAQRIVDTLEDVLDAGVMLKDNVQGKLHCVALRGWRSVDLVNLELRPVGPSCVLAARINDRWTLVVSSHNRRHDAQSFVNWAAAKLAPHLSQRPVSGPTARST